MVLSQYSIGWGMLFFLEAPFGKDSESIITRCGAQNKKNQRNNKSQQNSESAPSSLLLRVLYQMRSVKDIKGLRA